MLRKVVAIKSLGLLKDARSSPNFAKTTLLYAENGRGKSTFCQLLRSLGDGDMSVVAKKKTIDATDPIAASIVFDNGPAMSTLVAGVWDHLRSEIRVFDTHFVSKNVYAGASIDPDHRRNLLHFALGDAAVIEAERERAATSELSSLRATIRTLEQELAQHHAGTSLASFISLPKDDDIESAIEVLNSQISAAKRKEALMLRKRPEPVALISWDVSASVAALSQTLEGIEREAEQLVIRHITDLASDRAESWLVEGLPRIHDDNCPFCGQEISQLPLIDAYRGYFGDQYRVYAASLRELSAAFDAATDEYSVANQARLFEDQQAVAERWSDVLVLAPLAFDSEKLALLNAAVRSAIQGVFVERLRSPLETHQTEVDQEMLVAAVAAVDTYVGELNSSIAEYQQRVDTFRAALETEDVAILTLKRDRALMLNTRHSDAVAKKADLLVTHRARAISAESAKDEARENVRKIMNSTLKTYQADINDLLSAFGANFSIQEMKTNFRGSVPQSEYAIGLRSRSVPLMNELGPNFDSALSDGDKRTLAFAFFAASVAKSANVGNLILVIDDPMSSMDASRRAATIDVLITQQKSSAQLILSSHDPSFLKDFRQASRRADKLQDIQEIELGYAASGYSDWSTASIDKLCESVFLKMHRETVEFVDSGAGDGHAIGAHLRPLLEGYLHSRFPSHIADGLLLGECISAIRRSVAPSPLVFALKHVDEIENINTFVGRFHHSTSGAGAGALPNNAEVRTFAMRSLDVLHGRPVS